LFLSDGSKPCLGESFQIKQGVRQGEILSTFLYKVYNNALLQDLQSQKLGFMIGRTYVGCPTCADDIALLSNNVNELQDMLLTLHSIGMAPINK
jgi:hypothetical protein